jgi:hypothetical protein
LKNQSPFESGFFCLVGTLGKILTLDNLRRRHVIIINRCCMCKRHEKSVDHLLLHCETACALWNTIFSRFELSWVMPSRAIDLFACWGIGGRSRSAVVWKMVPSCLLWCLWRERNDRNFEDKKRSFEELKSFFFSLFVFLDFCLFSSCNLMIFLYISLPLLRWSYVYFLYARAALLLRF